MSDTGLKRSNEKFYTKNEVAIKCIQFVETYYDLNKFDRIIEPSAGNGSFSKMITCDAYDIEPEDDSIKKCDFLTVDIKPGNILCIGNPPFGRQSSLAKKFLTKCCSFSRVIAFILPKSFKKDSFQKCISLHFHLTYSFDLSKNSFLINNKEHDVPCVFQIWEKKDTKRTVLDKQKEDGYQFVKKEDAQFSFRRVGSKAGHFSKKCDVSIQSHYFLTFEHPVKLSLLNSIEWKHDNTVGPKSISKTELIIELNALMKKLPKKSENDELSNGN